MDKLKTIIGILVFLTIFAGLGAVVCYGAAKDSCCYGIEPAKARGP